MTLLLATAALLVLSGGPLGAGVEGAQDLDGVRLVTSERERRGLLVREDAREVHLKTSAGTLPVVVPKSAILQRQAVRVREDEAYTFDELIDARESKAGENAGRLLSAGRFAGALRRYERAAQLYRSAAAADPGVGAEAEKLLAENTALHREVLAEAELARIRGLAEKGDTGGAADAARKFLELYAGTAAAVQNQGIADELTAKVVKGLSAQVPALWRARRSARLAQYAGPGTRLADARARLAGLDAELRKELAAKLKVDVEDIRRAWAERDEKLQLANYGAGSWIVNGGQDGGVDWTPPPPPPPPPPGTEEYIMIPVRDAQGRVLYYVKAPVTPPRGPAPRARGLPLKTSDEWWRLAPLADRKAWLEAEYARTSAEVERLEELRRDCGPCRGTGKLSIMRDDDPIQPTCPRCHGARQDVSVRFK